ncbi:hypothetical protein RRG08_035559 [Elysia crispata]|uniref:Uncharacterized protein n=1 Tax=Elysia crispata TaxID=231223 RepID=A0AAE1E970_9GAST|nr:hypothetical protein RRG08_035559 [Elysia crispata]
MKSIALWVKTSELALFGERFTLPKRLALCSPRPPGPGNWRDFTNHLPIWAWRVCQSSQAFCARVDEHEDIA